MVKSFLENAPKPNPNAVSIDSIVLMSAYMQILSENNYVTLFSNHFEGYPVPLVGNDAACLQAMKNKFQVDQSVYQLESVMNVHKPSEYLQGNFKGPLKILSRMQRHAGIERSDDTLEEKEKVLRTKTDTFFKNSLNSQWKKYPESKLTGKYKGHQVQFFTMAVEYTKQATGFAGRLKEAGFDAELKKAKDKPSIIVDLTTSRPTLK